MDKTTLSAEHRKRISEGRRRQIARDKAAGLRAQRSISHSEAMLRYHRKKRAALAAAMQQPAEPIRPSPPPAAPAGVVLPLSEILPRIPTPDLIAELSRRVGA